MDIPRSSVKIFLANLGGSIVVFLGITYFARELGAQELGVFFLFQAVLGIIAVPADFGISGAVEKRLSEGDQRSEILMSAFALKAIPLAVLITGILLFQARINAYFGADLAVLLAIGLVLHDFAFMLLKVIQGELRVGDTAILRFAYKGIWVGFGGVLTFIGFSAVGIVYSYLLGLGVLFSWGLVRRSTPFGRPSWTAARSLFDYAKFHLVSRLGGTFYSWLDIAVIGFFLTSTHVGAYEVAWRVTVLVIFFSNAIGTSMLPQVSEWDATNSHDQIEATIHEVLVPSLVFVIPAFFGTLLLAPDILGLVFGPEFTIASIVLIILMGDKVFQAFQIIVGRTLLAIDEPQLAARATVIALVVNVCLNIIFVWQFGIVGAAVATVLASVLNDVLHYIYLSRFITIRFPVNEIGWCIIASTVMLAVLVITRFFSPIGNVFDLAVLITWGVVIYIPFVMVHPPIREKTAQYIPLFHYWANAE